MGEAVGPAAMRASTAAPGQVLSEQKISDTAGLFGGILDSGDRFGSALALLGDLNGDGVADLAVGSEGDDDEGLNRGAVWILFLDTDGTVKSQQKISDTAGNFKGPPFSPALDDHDAFGCSAAFLDDLDGDGVCDLAVGAKGDDDGEGSNRGGLYILFLDTDGTVKSNQKISSRKGGFTGPVTPYGSFGASMASPGDLDGDGDRDLVVGAPDHDGGRGAVWVLFLKPDGTVESEQEISEGNGLVGQLSPATRFGTSIAALGDLDGDEVGDIAVGAAAAGVAGQVWILFLNADGSVKSYRRIANGAGGFTGMLEAGDRFGFAVGALGDVDGDAIVDLGVGAIGDDDGGTDRGALWILFLDTDGTVQSQAKVSATAGGFGGVLDQGDEFGGSVCTLGDLDGDGRRDVAVGAMGDDDGGPQKGAVWGLFLDGVPATAQATGNNGSGINTPCYTTITLPVFGTTWRSQVDYSGHEGTTLTALLIYTQPSTGPIISSGELLIDLGSTFLLRDVLPTTSEGFHSIPIPNEPSMAGFQAYCQAAILGGGTELCNRLDLVIGF